MYEIIFELLDGTDRSLVTDSYATAYNTFDFYARQLSLFGLFRVHFVNYEEESMITAS